MGTLWEVGYTQEQPCLVPNPLALLPQKVSPPPVPNVTTRPSNAKPSKTGCTARLVRRFRRDSLRLTGMGAAHRPSGCTQADAQLQNAITAIPAAHRGRYAAPRIRVGRRAQGQRHSAQTHGSLGAPYRLAWTLLPLLRARQHRQPPCPSDVNQPSTQAPDRVYKKSRQSHRGSGASPHCAGKHATRDDQNQRWCSETAGQVVKPIAVRRWRIA